MKTHDQFVTDLNRSRQSLNNLALAASEAGFSLLIKPSSTAPDRESRNAHRDKGDAVIVAPIEHKHRVDLEFTCRKDYKFDTVIVDEQYKIDEKGPKDRPLMYVILNSDETHAAVVYGWTRKHWRVENLPDGKAGRRGNFYTCRKDVVRFCPVDRIFWSEPDQ